MIKSKVYLDEAVINKERKFGEATLYQPVIFVRPDGTEKEGFFTQSPIDDAIKRAKRNPEDMPEKKNLFQKIFGS